MVKVLGPRLGNGWKIAGSNPVWEPFVKDFETSYESFYICHPPFLSFSISSISLLLFFSYYFIFLAHTNTYTHLHTN